MSATSSTTSETVACAPSTNRQIADRFYAAVQAKNADGIAAVIEEGFAPDVVFRLSDGLPYGGAYEGRDKIRKLLTTLVTTKTPMVLPERIEIKRVIEQGDHLAYEARFPWLAVGAAAPIDMAAIEWWIFSDGKAAEVNVYYWDSAACVKAMKDAKANNK